MFSDFAEIWYTKVFECAECEHGAKILLWSFFNQTTCVLGVDPKNKLSDFLNEILYPGVFEGADFKNRIHSNVNSFFRCQ